MYKFIASLIYLVGLSFCSNAQQDKNDYFVFIDFATQAGPLGFGNRMYTIEKDSIKIVYMTKKGAMNDSTQSDRFDSSYYAITPLEKEKIISSINTIDTLKSVRNTCIDNGIRFYCACGIGDKEFEATVYNAYSPTMFSFLDIINAHVPRAYQMNYNKSVLIGLEEDCKKLKSQE